MCSANLGSRRTIGLPESLCLEVYANPEVGLSNFAFKSSRNSSQFARWKFSQGGDGVMIDLTEMVRITGK